MNGPKETNMACDYCSWLDRGWCRMEVWCNLYLGPEESIDDFSEDPKTTVG